MDTASYPDPTTWASSTDAYTFMDSDAVHSAASSHAHPFPDLDPNLFSCTDTHANPSFNTCAYNAHFNSHAHIPSNTHVDTDAVFPTTSTSPHPRSHPLFCSVAYMDAYTFCSHPDPSIPPDALSYGHTSCDADTTFSSHRAPYSDPSAISYPSPHKASHAKAEAHPDALSHPDALFHANALSHADTTPSLSSPSSIVLLLIEDA